MSAENEVKAAAIEAKDVSLAIFSLIQPRLKRCSIAFLDRIAAGVKEAAINRAYQTLPKGMSSPVLVMVYEKFSFSCWTQPFRLNLIEGHHHTSPLYDPTPERAGYKTPARSDPPL